MKHSYKFALFGNNYPSNNLHSIKQIINTVRRYSDFIYIESDFYHFINPLLEKPIPEKFVFKGPDFQADFAISIGGDGTFLKTACLVRDKEIPILGFNTGRLGFMADALPDEIEAAMEDLLQGRFEIEQRSVLYLEKESGACQNHPYALNEIAILKRDNSSMITIETYINNEYLTSYQADGLVICTPTGSTGYSLSVGGPIMEPQARTIGLTAVAPHSLNVRPLVCFDDVQIRLKVKSRSHNFLIAIDGRSERCEEGCTLFIRKAPYTVRFIRRNGKRFIDTLREKLMWGADPRN